MCIIYQRQPGVDIDYEKRFKPSVLNNPDGFGLSVCEGDGNLYTIKELVEKPDPEDLYRLVQEDYGDTQVLLHLRYTTAGETSYRNLHPFPILEKKTDGVDLRMAHNGTIYKYKHTGVNHARAWESDTRNFVLTYVRPLFKLLIKGNDVEELLTNPLIYGLLDEHLPNASVLAFLDGFGNTLEVNATGNGGAYEDEGKLWYSNKYSFDPDHRKPSVTGYGAYNNGGTSYRNQYANGQAYKQKADGTWGWVQEDQVSPPSGTNVIGQSGSTSHSSQIYSAKEHAMDTRTELFSEKYSDSITDLDDLFTLSDETLDYLQEEEPEDLALLCKELLYRCSGLKEAVDQKTIEIEALREKVKEEEKDGKAA